jgi:ParB family chromosome partitioning protein
MPTNAPETMGVIYRLQLSQLHPHPQNPFSIRDDQAMLDLIQSVQSHGVLVPAIARPRPDGEYEIIAGHRRKHASELAGLDFMPVVVLDLNDDEAIIQLVDSNIQRENILPSERAKAYKMRMEAMKRQGARTDLTSPNISAKFRSDDELGQEVGVSGDTIRNYASLTNLVPELMQMVDEGRIKLSPAYQIAALPHNEQSLLLDTIESEQATPSLSQAQRMKRLSQNGELNEDVLLEIMMEQKKPVRNDITLSGEKLRKYFPKSYSPIQMENVIFKLLEAWQRKRQRDQSR